MQKLTEPFIEQIRKELAELPSDSTPEKIETAAQRMEARNYDPILLTEMPGFLRITRDKLAEYLETLIAGKRDELTEAHLSLPLYHYRLIQRLRRDDPEAWDVVDELMDDD